MNLYFCEMSERNEIPLEEINIAGHRFTKDWKQPPGPPSVPGSNFDDLERKLAEDLKNRFNNQAGFGNFGGGNNNMGGSGPGGNSMGGSGNNMGGGGIGNKFNPYQNMDPKNLIGNPSNNGPNNNQFVGGNNPGSAGNPYSNPPANLGPNFFMPPDVTPKGNAQVKQSITSINDIDYYPEMDGNPALFNKGGMQDPDF
jgi:hypothetical protein